MVLLRIRASSSARHETISSTNKWLDGEWLMDLDA